MKKILLSIMFIATALFAEIDVILPKTGELKNLKEICKDSKILEIKQRGCCSWHGGVSGCSNGRVTCNDGSYSPSCTCYVPINPLS